MRAKWLFVLMVALGAGRAVMGQTNPTFLANIPKSSTSSWIATGLAVSGNYLYVTEDNGGSADPAFRIFDVSTPSLPVEIYRGGGPSCGGVKIVGSRAYVLDGGLKILDISNPKQPEPLGGIPTNFVSRAAIYHPFVYMDGVAYDVSNPASPVVVGSSPINGPVAFNGKYGYAVDNLGLAVLDLTDPAHPAVVAYKYLGSAYHVAVSSEYVFVASGTNCGVTVFDISCRTNPVIVSCLSLGCNRITVSGNFLYVLNGPAILDASNPKQLRQVGSFTYPPPFLFPPQGTGVAVARNIAYVSHFEGVSVFSLGDVAPPRLSITNVAPHSVGLSWPAPSPAFAVQETDENMASWETIPLAPVLRNLQNYVEPQRTNANMYYRLILQ